MKKFKVQLKDICMKSLEKRVQEKLNAGYTLHTPITPVKSDVKDYSWRDSKGNRRSFTEGSNIYTNYFAVVERVNG
jgi:hypothetical protein